jgi:Peptidase family M49
MRVSTLVVWAALLIGLAACAPGSTSKTQSGNLSVAPDIVARRAQFQPHTLTADVKALAVGDREALKHLVAAAREIDDIFKLQVWRGNPQLAPRVTALTGPDARAAQDYYRIMYGPWDRLKDFKPFLGRTAHPAGAGFYPEDMTKQELESWVKEHPGDREALTSLVTVVQRGDVGLVAVPYSQAYRPQLERAATELRAAADATDNQSLKRFLQLRADAFASDDYYQSDLAWMDLDSPLEVVIGPYETYEDGLFGYKAAFEAFLCVVEPEDSKRLAVYKSELPLLERELPIPDEHKNLDRGAASPIRVADEVFTAGDARAGVQTLAFNLPNDERVREAKGSKKVLLKNMMKAKYEAILEPIAARVLPEKEAAEIDFDSYYHFILFHELAHGLGPGRITVDGRRTEVRLELKDLYSAFEEAKADVVGVYNLYELADRGVVPMEVVEHLPWTYVAGLFRAARFGTSEAHGLGVVMQANYLLSKGAIEVTPAGRFRPHVDRFRGAIHDLAHELLMVEALGSHDRAHDFVSRYGTVPEAMTTALNRLTGIPVDVDPVYPLTGLQ